MVLLAGTGKGQSNDNFSLIPTIAFSGVDDLPCLTELKIQPMNQPSVAQIYLMSPDYTNVRRLTDNENCTHFDNFPSLSGDGKKIIFESNRLRSPTDPVNTSDLFLMDPDGSHQTWLVHGSSASWSPALSNDNHGVPQSKRIVFHASASGTQLPIRPDPGAPTFDSDLFVVDVDECLQVANCRDLAINITRNLEPDPDRAPKYNGGQLSPPNSQAIDEDADWSPDGSKVVFTSHPLYPACLNAGLCNYPDAEIYVINSDGTGLKQLTHNGQEERAPAWSPDGSRIVYMCRVGQENAQTHLASFELCVMSADGDGDGTAYTRLTWNPGLDATPSWSPDGREIVEHRNPVPLQLWLVKADSVCANGGCSCPDPFANGECETLLTKTPQNETPFLHAFPRWGVLRTHTTKP